VKHFLLAFRKIGYTINIIFFVSPLFLTNQVIAQSYSHTTVWSRLLVSKQVSKWIFTGDVAYRRQNDFHQSKINFLNKPLLDAQRLTIGYRSKDWLFSFAVSRWHAYQILGNETDFERTPTIEWRYIPGIEYFKKINKGILQWRTQYEYRSFSDRSAGRFRQRFQYRLPVSKTNNLMFVQEFLLGSPPNSTKRYEQNQLGLTFNHNFTDKLESEIGYRYIYRKRRISDEIDNENAFIMGLMLRL